MSEGLYASLNVGIGSRDNPDHVLENRVRVAAHFGLKHEHLATVQQIHSAEVVTLRAVPALEDRPQADGMVTSQPNIILGILTADCAPVLFADAAAKVIGAAHAGWKGAAYGVLENTLAAMEALGAQRSAITAYLGPCIAQESYEVGAEFYDRLVSLDDENKRFFVSSESRIPNPESFKYFFNLPAFVLHRLSRAGVAHTVNETRDTCADEKNFFSYRRATLRGQPDYGRQISCIVMKG